MALLSKCPKKVTHLRYGLTYFDFRFMAIPTGTPAQMPSHKLHTTT